MTREWPAFQAHRVVAGRHAQTILGTFLRSRRGVEFRRERVELDDGDFVDLDFAEVAGHTWPDLGERAPVCLLLHGLEGSARTGYAHETYRQLARRGVRPVGMNFRSCSGGPNRSTRLYHSGDTEDLRVVVGQLLRRFDSVPLSAIGFSLGGNVLLKYLGEEAERARLKCAVAVSVPYDLARCAEALESGMGRVYTWYLLRQLQGKLRSRRGEFSALCDVSKALRANSFFEFDDLITAPLHGFEGAMDYYTRSSSGRYLSRIDVPSLLIQAEDDPFVPADSIPVMAIEANPRLRLALAERGGHVGFLGPRRVEGGSWWAEAQAADFVASRGAQNNPVPPQGSD